MSNIKQHFGSKEGFLIEVDYKQLEVFVLALLSRDPTLTADLNANLDMHIQTTALMYGHPYAHVDHYINQKEVYWIDRRKKAKRISFLLQYGGGAKKASEETGVGIGIIKDYIRQYEERYVEVPRYYASVYKEVSDSSVTSPLRTKSGTPARVGTYTGPTGRTWLFREYDSPSWMSRPTSFMTPQMKNWPVQGTAADIVKAMMVYAMSKIRSSPWPNIRLVNQVHDSLLFDVPPEYAKDIHLVMNFITNRMSEVQHVLKTVFSIDTDLNFQLDTKVGANWKEME